MANEPKQTPRLIKAADVMARRAREATREISRASVLNAAARTRTPRDARDARAIFDALFEKPAEA